MTFLTVKSALTDYSSFMNSTFVWETRTDSQMHFFSSGELSCGQSEVLWLHRRRPWIFSWIISLYKKKKKISWHALFSGPTFWIGMSCKISTLINRQRAPVRPHVAACRRCYHQIFLSSGLERLVGKARSVKIRGRANAPIKFSGFEQFATLLRQIAVVTVGKWDCGLLPQTQKW